MSFYDAFHKPEPTPAANGETPHVEPGAASDYAAAALRRECEHLASLAPNTSRNDDLNTAAFNMGQLVGAGHISLDHVQQALAQAARAAGLPDHEIRTCLRTTHGGGLAEGAANPRRVPELATNAFTLTFAGVPQNGGDIPAEAEPTNPNAAGPTIALIPGGVFILDVPDTIPAIWGADNDIYWAEGESLIIAGPQGVGKTTLAIQLIRARLGLPPGKILGQPVQPGRRVLWLAMDRPAQARRAARRHFDDADRAVLDERLVVWQGPPPGDVAKHPGLLTHLAQQADADTLIIDSVKDAAIGLSDDAVGAGYNRARQGALTAGIQIVELHHQVKRGAQGGVPNTLADLYGSVWIPAGAGSVLLLWGEAGDPIVSMRHLKQPMNEIGPLQLTHDHITGTTSIVEGIDLVDLVRYAHADGLTAKEAAARIFDTGKPTAAQGEKMRRRLDRLVDAHVLTRVDGTIGGGVKSPSRYYLGGSDLTFRGGS